MKILIVGGGIAGCTLGYFLKKYGFHPTIVESAPKFERLGYLLGIREVGLSIAEKMGIRQELQEYEILFSSVWNDIHGKRIKRFNTEKNIIEFSGLILNRADLHLCLYNSVKNDIEFRFSTEPLRLQENAEGVSVTFNTGKKEDFALVIGADGFTSKVRNLIFGEGFERFLHASFFAFIIPNRAKLPIAKQHETVSVRGPDFFISYGPFSQDDSEIGCYVFHRSATFEPIEPRMRREYLLNTYGEYDPVFRRILETMKKDDLIYQGDVSQIVMERWSKGRVCLLGDAGYCLSPASGMGASIAMAGGYMLAKALKETTDYKEAFRLYEKKLRPHVERLQAFGQEMARFIVGDTVLPYEVINTLLRLTPEFFITRYLLRNSTKKIPLDG